MIKLIVQVTKLVIAAVTALLFGSCNFVQGTVAGVNGNGNITTQNRDVNDFTFVSAASGLTVTVEQGTNYDVVVEADENLQEHIKTEVSNNELKIYSDINIRHADSKKVTVKLPKVEGLSSSSGSSLKSISVIKSDNLSLSSSSGSSMAVAINAQNVTCETSSGSTMKIEGKAGKAETSSSSGSSLNADKLSAKNVVADASSGSSTHINSLESLDAKSSSGASISYSGNPARINKKSSSGGSVSQN